MQDEHQEKQELLAEIKEMLNIPQLERIIFHKIKELKFFFREEIERYRQLKDGFRRSAYGELKIVDSESEFPEKTQAYHFELDLNKRKEWVISSIEPSPPPGYEVYDIIPDDIVKYIVSIDSSPGKIESHVKVSFPDIKGKMFDLGFAKYSDSHILGLITGYDVLSSLEHTVNQSNDLTDIYNCNQEKNDEGNFRDLIYFMQKYPSVKHYFFTELNMKVKPLIIGNLIDITSSSQPSDQF